MSFTWLPAFCLDIGLLSVLADIWRYPCLPAGVVRVSRLVIAPVNASAHSARAMYTKSCTDSVPDGEAEAVRSRVR